MKKLFIAATMLMSWLPDAFMSSGLVRRAQAQEVAQPTIRAATSDTVLQPGSYLGGAGRDEVRAVTTDRLGNIYLTGSTNSRDFPARTVARSGDRDVFVTKISADGRQVLYSVRIGGVQGPPNIPISAEDEGLGIAVDRFGNAYVVGRTLARDFPTTSNALQTTPSGGFLFKLDPSGSRLLFSTYFGGTRAGDVPAVSAVNGIALGPNDDIYVTGETNASDFPAKGAFQAQRAGEAPSQAPDAFVARLSADGAAIRYATYLGGRGNDSGRVIAVDRDGSAYVAGISDSGGFPLQNPIPNADRGVGMFMSKISPLGNRLLFSSYLSGEAIDEPTGLVVAAPNQIVVTGRTSSARFPTQQPLHPARRGRSDIFVAKIDVAAPRLIFSTYFGGSGDESGGGVAITRDGSIVVTGGTQSSDLPVRNAYQSTLKGGSDAFSAVLSGDGQRLIAGSYFGGSGHDASSAAVLNNGGDLILAGTTLSRDLPVRNGFQPRSGDGEFVGGDGFLAILNLLNSPPSDTGDPGVAFLRPQNGARLAAFPIISGVATDVQNGGVQGSGVARVVLFIKRSRDGKYFSGRNWASVAVALETQIEGETWQFRNVPTDLNAQDGTYLLTAVAFDRVGHRSLAATSAFILDRSAVTVT